MGKFESAGDGRIKGKQKTHKCGSESTINCDVLPQGKQVQDMWRADASELKDGTSG